MVVGLGIDLTPISRVEALLARHGGRFERKVFTNGERAECQGRGQPAQHFAARFAAKEAALKAMRVPSGLTWHEMEVVSGPGGAPTLVLRGAAEAAARALGATRWHLTLTHAADLAAAVVVLDGG